jgi:aminoglycoside 3-N-acetyltransferase
MSEERAIQLATSTPVTIDSIESDLKELGVEPGACVLVHSSLSSMGWVCGGPVSVILALEEVIRPFGLLVMPAHSGDLSDPSGWQHPPVPESWWEEIRRTMPAFDPEFTPTRGMGVIPETFRKQLDVVRSSHPQLSFTAWGEECLSIVADHSLAYGLGEQSPLAQIYNRDGWVLLIGVGHESNTSLHLAELRAEYPDKPIIPCSAPVMVDGHRRWKSYEELDYESDDFTEFGHDFLNRCKHDIHIGTVGYAKAQLFRQRICVDFATQWFHRNRR